MSYETLNPFDPTIPEPVHVFMAGVVEPEEVEEERDDSELHD